MIEAFRPLQLDTVLLKVASRCNLDCGYCYVYHMGDDAWRSQPKRMDVRTADAIASQLGEIYRAQATPFSVVLHGGEPLLLGANALSHMFRQLRRQLPNPCGLHVQTNGILISDALLDIFVQYDVGISISIDGPANVHDRFRVDHKKNGSHARVIAGIERIIARDDARPLFAGVLAVIDPTSEPGEVYEALKATRAPSFDVLVRDGNWDNLPFGKKGPETTEYGEWLSALLQIYLEDKDPPRIRLFDDMLRLLLGGTSQKEGIGTTDYGIIVVEPDGRIDKNDTLKVAHANADRFEADWNVHSHSIAEIMTSADYQRYYRGQRPTAAACKSCPVVDICGGGMVAHRWSAKRGYDNPTIFCADQIHLIGQMKLHLARAGNDALEDAA